MWKSLKLEDVCQIGDGNHSSNYPKASEMVEKGVPFLRAGNIQGGTVSSEDLKFITPEKHLILKKGHLKEGDVLITNRGEIGKTAVVPKIFEGANLNSQIAWLRPDDRLLSQFLFYALSAPDAKASFKSQQSGTALQQLTIRQIKNLHISYPPLAEQQRIVAKLDAAFAEIDRLINTASRQASNAKDVQLKIIEKLFFSEEKEWKKINLRTACKFSQGVQIPVEKQSLQICEGCTTRFLRIVDFTQGNEEPRFISDSDVKEILNEHDIAIVRYGASAGFVCTGLKGQIANNLCVLT
jgi:type I restriction enzyme S subunit